MAMRLQVELTRPGYYMGTIDGMMSSETQAALQAFQSSQGLEATGTITPGILTRLGLAD
jgi:peptidoglycan hydrolase-like protein with peptidoglycan-binding domain